MDENWWYTPRWETLETHPATTIPKDRLVSELCVLDQRFLRSMAQLRVHHIVEDLYGAFCW